MWVAVRVVPHPNPLPHAGEGTDRANNYMIIFFYGCDAYQSKPLPQ